MRKVAGGIVAILLSLSLSVTAHAYSAEELYAYLGIDYQDPHSQEDIDTITKYRCAQRYVRIFSHLSTMTFTETDVSSMVSELKDEIAEVESALDNGFSLGIEEIYSLEIKYRELSDALVKVTEIAEVEEVPLKQLNLEDIPSYNDYAKANARNTIVETRLELGSNVPSLTPNAYVVSDYTDSSLTIGTSELAIITSLFNGEVIDVTDDIVTINHFNGIYTSYRGLIPSVEIGETVYQGKSIGYSSGSVSVRMKVADTFVNIYEYLKGVSDGAI